jgi:sulfatase modifying factor 1
MPRVSLSLAIIISLLFSISTVFAADTPPVKLKLRESEIPTKENVKTVSDPTTGMQLVFVKGGCYQMGKTNITMKVTNNQTNITKDGLSDSKPVHEVCLSDFYLGKYEVTQSQWEKIMGKISDFEEQVKCGQDCPVADVSWNKAQEFIKKLNTHSGKQYRLPTEAEWEYAAKSGGKDEEVPGKLKGEKSPIDRYAWGNENSNGTIHKVGLKKPNGLGLYDMSGNVSEWCQDWYNEGYYDDSPKDNPTGPDNGEERVMRGGSWKWGADITVKRRSGGPTGGSNAEGFRLLLPAQ